MAQPKIDGEQIDGGTITGVDADALGGQIGSFYQNAGNLNAGTILSARLTGTYAIGISGSAAQLNGQTASFYRNATNLNAGTINDARLPTTITSNITGNAATCTTAANSNALGGVAAASWAKLASPIFSGNPTAPTQAPGTNNTRLATTAFVLANSGGATVTSSGTLAFSGPGSTTSWAHGQGVVPKLVQISFINVVSQGGFTPGTIISLNNMGSETDSGSNYNVDGIGVQLTSTQVIVRVSNRSVPYVTTTGGGMALGAGNWSMLIRIIT